MSFLDITPDLLKDLNHRVRSHTEVNDIAVVVLTARELEGLLNVVESALDQGTLCKRCKYYIPDNVDKCESCCEKT